VPDRTENKNKDHFTSPAGAMPLKTENSTVRTPAARPSCCEDLRGQDRLLRAAAVANAALVVRELLRAAPRYLSAPADSHELLVIPFLAFLLWRKRRELSRLPRSSAQAAPFIAPAALLLFLAGKQAAVPSVETFGLLLFLWTLCAWFLGTAFLRKTAFEIALSFFLLPPPGALVRSITLPMRLFATAASCTLARLLGLPAQAAGTTVILPGGTLSIESACSGLRGVITLLIVAIFLGELRSLSLRRRLLLIAAAPVAAVLLNILRIVVTIGAAHFAGLEAATSTHTFTGLVLIAAGALVLALLARPSGNNVTQSASAPREKARPAPCPAFALILVFTATAFSFLAPNGYTRRSGTFAASSLPLRIGPYMGEDVPVEEKNKRLLGTETILWRRYRRPDRGPSSLSFEVICVFYPSQGTGRQPHDPTLCLLGSGWSSRADHTVILPVDDPLSGKSVKAREIVAQQGAWSIRLLSFVVTPGGTYARLLEAKVKRLFESLFMLRRECLWVRLAAKSAGRKTEELYEFARLILPYVFGAYKER